MKRITADMHIHSKYSFDSSLKIKYILKRMEELHAKYIAITDHVEFSNQPVNEVMQRIRMRNLKIDELSKGTDITIIKGVEVSEPHLYPSAMESLKSLEDIDYIVGSIHHLCDASMKKMAGTEGAMNLYFESMLNMIHSADIDTLAHLDYMKRYLTTFNPDPKLVDEVLKAIIAKNIILEINTSGMRRCKETFPSPDIIKRYAELGGKKVVYGSDAHTLEQLGDYIPEAHEDFKDYNFEEGIVLKREFRKI